MQKKLCVCFGNLWFYLSGGARWCGGGWDTLGGCFCGSAKLIIYYMHFYRSHFAKRDVNLLWAFNPICWLENFLQVIGRRRGKSASGSQSSLASTPGHSNTSNRKSASMEWPDPPDIPICSTEDEANSIYSDSDDLHIPSFKEIQGREGGTYVIRKGRKVRQRLEVQVDDSMSSLNSRLSNEGNFSITSSNVPSPVFPASMHIPNSRHSIDLGNASSNGHHQRQHQYQPAPTSMLSPRFVQLIFTMIFGVFSVINVWFFLLSYWRHFDFYKSSSGSKITKKKEMTFTDESSMFSSYSQRDQIDIQTRDSLYRCILNTPLVVLKFSKHLKMTYNIETI